MIATRSILREIIMVIAAICSAIAAGFSALAAFRLENATYATASRQENATYTTALYVKEVDAISTFLSTAREIDNSFLDVLSFYGDTFAKPYPARDVSGLRTFTIKADSLLRAISDHGPVLRTQATMISIFAPIDLSDHFYKIIDYYHQNLVQFLHSLSYINEQLSAAAINPKQQIVMDVDSLRTTQEHFFKLIEDEKRRILICIKPQLATGRPITAQSELAGCLQKNSGALQSPSSISALMRL